MERCPHCGAELPDTTDAFCPECREPLEDDPLTTRPAEPPPPEIPLRELALEEIVQNGMSREELVKELEQGGRFVVYKYCISVVFFSTLNPSRIYFFRAGEDSKAGAWKYNLLTVLLGWWGIPWGPIYSFSAVATNKAGGQDVTDEVLKGASKLAMVGYLRKQNAVVRQLRADDAEYCSKR